MTIVLKTLNLTILDSLGTLDSRAPTGAQEHPPRWVSAPTSLSAMVGSTYDMSQHAYDQDGDTLAYSLPTTRDGIVITAGGMLQFGSSASATTGDIVVRISDAAGGFDDTTCAVTVVPASTGGVVADAVLRSAGYVLVTDSPYNADPTGINDSTAGIQAAMDYAYTNSRPVWFKSGTYLITNTLRGYEYQLWNNSTGIVQTPSDLSYRLYGAQYPSRPVIQLGDSLSLFSNRSQPRPVLYIMNYEAINSTGATKPAPQSYPYDIPAGFKETSPNGFGHVIDNIDFSLGQNNPGADGVSLNGAQRCVWNSSRIVATGANCGVENIFGQGSLTHNIEVVGGRIPFQCSGGQGPTVVGLKVTADADSITCVNHTVDAVVTLVGFELSKPTSGSVLISASSTNYTMRGTYCLVDGSVSVAGGIAFDNPDSNNLYLRNVYVSGTDALVKSGLSATWQPVVGVTKRIDEYCCTNPNGTDYAVGASAPAGGSFRWASFINGTKSTGLEPVKTATSVASIPGDIRSRHVGRPHRIDDGPYVDIRDTGATSGSALAGINAAIAQAKAVGHGRVLIPVGRWTISSKLAIDADSNVFGIDPSTSFIVAGWNPTTTTEYVIDTPSSADGTATLSYFQVEIPTPNATGPWHNHVRWRVGRRSSMFGSLFSHAWIQPDQALPQRKMWVFEGNGGGRHWSCEQNGRGLNGIGTRVVHINGTTQPLSIYGNQVEIGKGSAPAVLTNIEVTNAQNVRFYMTKREGSGGTLLVNGNSSNIAWYGQSAARSTVYDHYFHITDTATNILVAGVGCQSTQGTQTISTTKGMLKESGSVGSSYQPFPMGVSLYKRGTINDSLMVHT